MLEELKVKISKFIEYFPILIAVISYGSIAVAILNAPWFRWEKNALSDLGATPGSDIYFNAGLIISGILLMIYVSHIAKDYLEYLALHGIIFLFLAGLCLMSIGIFPEQVEELHFAVSLGFFVSFPLGQFLFSIYLKIRKNYGHMLILGILSFIGSIFIWAYPWKQIGISGVAIPELLSSLLGMIWLLVFFYTRLREKKFFSKH